MASFARQQVERAALVHVFLKQLARTVCEDESLSLFHSPHAREYARLTCQIMTEDVNHQLLFFDQVKKRGGIETIRRLMRDELTYDMLQKFLADWKEPHSLLKKEKSSSNTISFHSCWRHLQSKEISTMHFEERYWMHSLHKISRYFSLCSVAGD